MPEDDFLRVMETLWKGVDPKKSGRYKQWSKNRWSPGYKWPYQKSRIKGPDIKKSHMADLSPGESVELQSKYADDIWEYKMKKKLGRAMDEDLEYPFLNPENDAFISTEPRTGLGRYQMRHFVDPENVGPVDKYQVYDWWDDVPKQNEKKTQVQVRQGRKGKNSFKGSKMKYDHMREVVPPLDGYAAGGIGKLIIKKAPQVINKLREWAPQITGQVATPKLKKPWAVFDEKGNPIIDFRLKEGC